MNFPGIRIEGAILSPDILDRLDDAPGQHPSDFGLDPSDKVKDEIARAWAITLIHSKECGVLFS